MNDKQTADLRPFFKLAQRECCNYSAIGPFQRKHYCCLEPRRTEYQCLLSHNLPCPWFVEATLPLDLELKEQWGKIHLMDSDTDPPARSPRSTRTCTCGKLYLVKSNRQRMCPECSERNRKKLNRKASSRYRVKRLSRHTLEPSNSMIS